MLVTIVSAVTGNAFMGQAIESVQRQTYTDIEHLIVIDGKEREEKARAILANIDTSRITTHIVCLPYPTGKNRFICHRIYGMAAFLINGDYVCYLDEDNWYDPEHIEALVRITQEKGLDWAYSLRKIIDRDGNFLCLDDCESLGKWQHPTPNTNRYYVDRNCYFLKKSLALKFSHVWYVKPTSMVRVKGNIAKIRRDENTYSPNAILCNLLLEQYPQVDTSGIYSVNYRLGGSENPVKPDFFYHFNQIRQQEYPNGFPWRKTKLKDITLPRLLPKTADTTSYSEEFFHWLEMGARNSARAVLPYLAQLLDKRIQSVVDVGCGTGEWLAEAMTVFNTDDVLGVDGEYVTKLKIPSDRFQVHDLSRPFSIDRRFDLVISLEVAEHLPSERSFDFVTSLVNLGDVVLFSAAIPLQPGTNHINTQWCQYWVELFDRHNYKCVDCLRDRFWQDDRVEWWYAQNMLLFVKQEVLTQNDRLLQLQQKTDLERLVRIHPKNTPSKIAFGHDDTIELTVSPTEVTTDERYKFHRELLFKFFDQSPYENFPYLDYPRDLQGWGSEAEVFKRLIEQVKPSLILEVGTWKGASAIHMVNLLKAQNIVAPVICIDTWLGGIETVKGNPVKDITEKIPRRFGYPQLYFQFLANVLHSNAQNYIVPIPLHSTAAFKLLSHWQIKADFIYIDGSHEEEDVYADLCHYWQLLRSEGILLGDDYYDRCFPGVFLAAHRFAKENNLQLCHEGNKFWFKKPVSVAEQMEALSKRLAALELKNNPDIDLSYFN